MTGIIKVYFAGPWTRRSRIKDYARQSPYYIESTSYWLDTDGSEGSEKMALLDLADIDQADAIVCYVSPEGWGHAFEMGYALARGKTVVGVRIMGGDQPRTFDSVFLYHPSVKMVDTFEEAYDYLKGQWEEGLLHDQPQESERVRHPSSQEFVDNVMGMIELHDSKQEDYGTLIDPFANVRNSEDFGLPSWIGCFVRANDKMKRIQKASLQTIDGKPIHMAYESVEDSMRDLAVYAMIGLVLFREWSDGDR